MKKIVLRAFLLFLLCSISIQTVYTKNVYALADDATSTGNTPSCSSLGLGEKIKEGDHNGISIPSPTDFQITVLSRSELLIQTTAPSKTFFAAGGSPTYGEIFGDGCIVSDQQLDSAFTYDQPDSQFFTVDRFEWSDGTNMGNAFDDIEYGLGQFNTSALTSVEIRWVFQNSDNFSTNEYIYFLDPYWYYSNSSSSDPANENGTHGITVTNILNKKLLNHVLKISGSPGNIVLTTSPSQNPRTFSQGNAPTTGTLASGDRVVFYRNLANGDDGLLALPKDTTIEAFLQAMDFVDMEYYESLDDTTPQIVPVLGGVGQEALNDSIPEGAQGGNLSTRPSCETAANWAFGFVVCPLLDMADRAIGWLDNRIISSLSVNDAYYENAGIRDAWGNVRNIALILLIPVMLLMVIGTALQFSFVDAYTVKRALPRLFVAIIFIAVSYDVCALLIQITNEVGRGVAGIITSPFGGLSELTLDKIFANGQTGDTVLFGGGVLAGIGIAFMSGVTIWTLFSFVGMGALALLIIFVLLSVRELMIVFLLVVSPIAIVTWIFPGNDKGWKLWWGTFSKMLLIYPIIMAFLGMGRAFATIVGEAGGDAVISTIVKLVAFIGPYFFIPKAFQMAGGAFANLAGMVNDRGKGIFDRQRKFRQNQMKNKRQAIATGRGFRGVNPGDKGFRGFVSKRSQNAYLRKDALAADGLRRGLSRASRDAAKERMEAAEEEHASKDPALRKRLRNDDFAHILSLETEAEMVQYLTQEKGYGQAAALTAAAQAMSFRDSHGAETTSAMALVAKAGAKTSYNGGLDEMLRDIVSQADGDENKAMTLLGEMIGSAHNAGRFDLSGGSYGEKAAMLKARMQGRDIEYEDEMTGERKVMTAAAASDGGEVNRRQAGKALDGLNSFDLQRMHPTAARNLAMSYGSDIQHAFNNVESTREELSRLSAIPNRNQEQNNRLSSLQSQLPQLEAAFGQRVAHAKHAEQLAMQIPGEAGRALLQGLTNQTLDMSVRTSTPTLQRTEGGTMAGHVNVERNEQVTTVQQLVRVFENNQSGRSQVVSVGSGAQQGAQNSAKGFDDLSRNPYAGMSTEQMMEMQRQQQANK